MSSKRQKSSVRTLARPVAPAAASRKTTWPVVAIVATLVVLTAAVFAGVRSHDFVDFDDGLYVVDNPHVRGGLSAENVAWAFTAGHAANWHPLTWISHQADVSMFGMTAGAHHITNLVWHALNTVLLFGLLRSITGATWKSALVAALFAVHPAHVESVAWISERKDVLSTFFLIAATWAWTRWTKAPSRASWVLALCTFGLGLMSKPMLMTLPFAWMLLDLWPLGRTGVPLRKRVLEKAPFLLLAIASFVVTIAMQQQGGAVTSLDNVTVADRIANAVVSYARYLGMLVWPQRLTAFYPYSASIAAASVAGAAVLLAAISAAVWLARGRFGFLLVGWLWFLGTLVPVIGLVQIGMQSHADRYTYVPYIGLFIAAVWGAGEIANRSGALRLAVSAMSVVAVVALSVVAHAQVATWRSSEILWSHAVAVMPENAKAHNSLGAIYGNTGRVREAEVEFKEALRLRPDLTEGLHIYPNLGRALAAQGKLAEALPYLERARKLKPDDAALANELGLAYLGLDRTADAIGAWRDAVRLNPALEEAWFVMGIALAASGRIADARQAFTEVVRINPGRKDAEMALQRLR